MRNSNAAVVARTFLHHVYGMFRPGPIIDEANIIITNGGRSLVFCFAPLDQKRNHPRVHEFLPDIARQFPCFICHVHGPSLVCRKIVMFFHFFFILHLKFICVQPWRIGWRLLPSIRCISAGVDKLLLILEGLQVCYDCSGQ